MRYIQPILITLLLFNLACGKSKKIDPNIKVTIEKRFDHGTLTDHTITAANNKTEISMRFSQRRVSEGSKDIANSHITYWDKAYENTEQLTAEEMRSFLISIMNKLHEEFGTDLRLNSLASSKYLGVKDIEKKGIIAFRDFKQWKAYLKDKSKFSENDIYNIVLNRWKEKKVYSDIIDVFSELGYSLELERFEKLLIFKADKCPFYDELDELGIKKDDMFPYPGNVSFKIRKKK